MRADNPHAPRPVALHSALLSLWRHRRLVRELTWREISGRYRGSWFGIGWSLLHPLLMLAVYTFVFSVVFGARWSAEPGTGPQQHFALFAFAGVLMHGLLSEVLVRSGGVVVGNVNYVKKVVFPLEILSVTLIGAALFHLLIGMALLVIGAACFESVFGWSVLWLPLLVLPLVVFSLGVSWWLAALGVYIRDITQLAVVVSSALLFLAPVFYPAHALPEPFIQWITWNPLTAPIEQVRRALFLDVGPEWGSYALQWLAAVVVAQSGYWFFQRSRSGFADVL